MSGPPRGFIQRWTPRAETNELLIQVNRVLVEYLDLLQLTLRQIMKIRNCVTRRSGAVLATFDVEMASGTIINRPSLVRGKNGT
jgi:hypothetical protein